MGRTVKFTAGLPVLVTGAASGIGRAVARQLGARGARLYLTDVNQAGLEAAASDIGEQVVLARAADVSRREDILALAQEVHASTDALGAVLNVAGIAIWGTVQTMTHEQWREVIEVNLMGPIHVIEAFVPPMIAAGRGGYLVNVSSAAGLIGLPWHAAYSASKFGLRGVSEVLRFDLRRHGISVSLVCPGAVDTPLTRTVRVAGTDTSGPEFEKLRARFRSRAVSPDAAAAAIISGMLSRRYLIYTSQDIRAIHALQRYVPPVYTAIMRGANRAADRFAASTGGTR